MQVKRNKFTKHRLIVFTEPPIARSTIVVNISPEMIVDCDRQFKIIQESGKSIRAKRKQRSLNKLFGENYD